MDGQQITRFAHDPAAFRRELVIPSAHGPARFGDVMADFQARDFAALDQGFTALAHGAKPDPSRYWLERTKGASKDSDLACELLWLLAFCPRSLSCQVGAADRDQADELRRAAKGILRLNPWLVEVLTVQALAITNERTESVCEIVAADVAGSHGARPDLLILNELSHIGRREFAENLLDNAAKVPAGVVVIATNAGHDPSWQHDWRERARTSDRWYFSAVSEPAPWLDAAELAEAEKRNSLSRFARLWRGVWVTGQGDALDPADITAAVDGELVPMDHAETGWIFFAGLDLGIKHDRAALAVVGRHVGHQEKVEQDGPRFAPVIESAIDAGLMDAPLSRVKYIQHPASNRLRLARIASWAPRPGGQVDLQRVEAAILGVQRALRPVAILYDPYQAALLAQRLARQGVVMRELTFAGQNLSELASTLLEEFKARNVDLFHDPELIADLGKLRIVERNFGYKLEAPRDETGHADRATALTLALLGAKRFQYVAPVRVPRPLVLYP